MRSELSDVMNQMLETEQRTTLFQETIAPSYNLRLKTSAIEASCYVCGKGIQDGYSLTAKKSLGSMLLFCDKGDFLKVYKKLRDLNPSPYLYHMKMDNRTIIGASPEMLIRVTGDKVETFPIAGTRKITSDEKRNEELKQELLHDEKELAEHTMLVDLGRNDIGRVCKYGSVHVEELMEVKKFSHVQHMVTHVVGKLDKKYDMFDALKAVFPAGTVSGAPKVRAMEIIDELEPQARGPYAGAVGYFSFNGCCDFAIAIRSIFIDNNKGYVQAGAGIVSDSIPKNELKETEHKANAMLISLKEAAN